MIEQTEAKLARVMERLTAAEYRMARAAQRLG